jgi:tetratricopeptide (TPR) repeat protein
MIQLLRIVVVIVIFATGVPRSSAQAPSTASSSQSPLEEAAQLNQVVARLGEEGKYGEAIAPAERALALLEKALGPNHPNVADSLNTLAVLYQAQGAYTRAERLLIRALDIREKALGPHHPTVATNLNNLAVLCWTHGAYAQAKPLLARAADIAEQQLRTMLARLSESRKRDLMALLQGDTDRLVSFHADATPNDSPALELALTTVLRRKGRIVDSVADSQTRLRAHLTPALQQQLDQLSHVRSELVGRLYAPAGPPAAAAVHRDEMASLRVRMDKLEAQLSAVSDEFRTEVAPVTMAAVQAEIPADAALVEFVRYHRFVPGLPQPWQDERYVAYLLTRQGHPAGSRLARPSRSMPRSMPCSPRWIAESLLRPPRRRCGSSMPSCWHRRAPSCRASRT